MDLYFLEFVSIDRLSCIMCYQAYVRGYSYSELYRSLNIEIGFVLCKVDPRPNPTTSRADFVTLRYNLAGEITKKVIAIYVVQL